VNPRGSATPVFLDRSGRRRRWLTLFGVSMAVVLSGVLALLVLGFTGTSTLRVPGFPDLNAPATGAAHPPSASPAVEPAGSAVPAPPETATPDRTSPRHIPTQTPSRDPKPTRS
jgi:hypothetical protein